MYSTRALSSARSPHRGKYGSSTQFTSARARTLTSGALHKICAPLSLPRKLFPRSAKTRYTFRATVTSVCWIFPFTGVMGVRSLRFDEAAVFLGTGLMFMKHV